MPALVSSMPMPSYGQKKIQKTPTDELYNHFASFFNFKETPSQKNLN